jgi:hypothetical protein
MTSGCYLSEIYALHAENMENAHPPFLNYYTEPLMSATIYFS